MVFSCPFWYGRGSCLLSIFSIFCMSWMPLFGLNRLPQVQGWSCVEKKHIHQKGNILINFGANIFPSVGRGVFIPMCFSVYVSKKHKERTNLQDKPIYDYPAKGRTTIRNHFQEPLQVCIPIGLVLFDVTVNYNYVNMCEVYILSKEQPVTHQAIHDNIFMMLICSKFMLLWNYVDSWQHSQTISSDGGADAVPNVTSGSKNRLYWMHAGTSQYWLGLIDHSSWILYLLFFLRYTKFPPPPSILVWGGSILLRGDSNYGRC